MQIPSIHGVAGKDSVFAKWARNGECILWVPAGRRIDRQWVRFYRSPS
jgi:hypothetical protein